MGKNYATELTHLHATYAWALSQDVSDMGMAIRNSISFPSYSVGSGGSLSAACLASLLHQRSGSIGKAITPLELQIACANSLPSSSLLFLSASGGNPDIVGAFNFAANAEPRFLNAICMKTNTMLSSLVNEHSYARFFEYDLPSGSDGFLATNSLLAFFILLIRSYKWASGDESSNPFMPRSPGLYFSGGNDMNSYALLRDSFIVLYSGWSQPVAADLESKFSEGALGHVQLTDYRNFGHGRHNWVAKRNASTAIIAFTSPEDEELARRTLKHLPSEIPIQMIQTDRRGPWGSVDLLMKMFNVVGYVGQSRGIDPGRPGVPEFGRRLYHVRVPHRKSTDNQLPKKEATAIQRKCSPFPLNELRQAELLNWRKAYSTFRRKLSMARFGAIALDYDGTICSSTDRYNGLTVMVGDELVRLLRAGIIIGIATGRGQSVRTALLSRIPTDLAGNVYIGYYNGAITLPLLETLPNEAYEFPHGLLGDIGLHLGRISSLYPEAKLTYRKWQITVELPSPASVINFMAGTEKLLVDFARQGGQVLRSSNSIDILDHETTKVMTVREISELLTAHNREEHRILCIGDRGKWPGNDYDLLSEPYSLSVDEVSSSPTSCWNLAAPGARQVSATLEYLRSLRVSGHGFFVASKL